MERKWITGADVARKLGKEESEIFDLLASGELLPYDHNGKKIKWLDFNRNRYDLWENKWQNFLICRFLQADIDAFEIADGKKTETAPPATAKPQPDSASPVQKPVYLKPVEEDKWGAIEIAEKYMRRCKGVPSIKEAVYEVKDKLNGHKSYTEKTIRRWINKSFPPESRKPGRPKNEP